MIGIDAASQGSILSSWLPTVGLVCGLVVAAIIVILRLRRSIFQESESRGFTLQDIRELKAKGQISDEEYERARTVIIGSTTSSESASGKNDKNGDAGSG